jgi:hypothetical protein
MSPTLSDVGAWGTAIFDDDTAADVRGEWRDAILEGLTAEEASDRLRASFKHALADQDESKIFWLALAAAQMETGRLQDDVRDRALAIIEGGGDVARWAEEDEGLARKTAARLESPRGQTAWAAAKTEEYSPAARSRGPVRRR